MKNILRELHPLELAARDGLLSQVESLLRNNSFSEECIVAAYVRALEHHHKGVAALLQEKITKYDEKKTTIVHWADNAKMMEAKNAILMQCDDTLDNIMNNRVYHLIQAAEYGYIRLFIPFSLTHFRQYKIRNYLLHIAAKFGHIEIVEHLIKHDAIVDSNNFTALSNAITGRQFAMVRFLLSQNYYIFAKLYESIFESFLMKAPPNLEMLKILLTHPKSKFKAIVLLEPFLMRDHHHLTSCLLECCKVQNTEHPFIISEPLKHYMDVEFPLLKNVNPTVHHVHEIYQILGSKIWSVLEGIAEIYCCANECPTEILDLIKFQIIDIYTGKRDSCPALLMPNHSIFLKIPNASDFANISHTADYHIALLKANQVRHKSMPT